VKPEKTKATSIFAVLLIYLLMVGNTSGGLVLCIGADGHIELERAFHECCHHPSYGQQKDVHYLSQETDSHAEGRHCEFCIDVPISMGLTGDQLPPNQVKVNSQTLISFVGPRTISDNTLIAITAAPQLYAVSPPSTLLRTVILLV
jgi:hypothetical protein